MSIYHDDKTDNKVTIVKTVREIEVPNFIPVDIDRPTFIDKEYERPVIKDVPYERPVITNVNYERPVIIEKKQTINIPVVNEVPYDVKVPVPVEVPYDLPVVSMTQLNEMALEVKANMKETQDLLKDLSGAIDVLKATIGEVNKAIPTLIKVPNIIKEDIIVKVPRLIEETKYVIGKIVVKGD